MRRLAHISDLHFGRTDPSVVAALIGDLNAFEPDLVIVTGDVTQRARQHQFKEARRFLDRLPARRLVVPGNHDIAPFYQPVARLLDPYRRYRHFIDDELDSVFYDEELLVLGLNTANHMRFKEGGVSANQLSWLLSHTRRRRELFSVIATHHPLIRPLSNPIAQSIRGSVPLLLALEAAGVDLLLSGHLHETISGPATARVGAIESVLAVQASTATSTRLRGHKNAYNRIAIDLPRVCIEVRAWVGERFDTDSNTTYERQDEIWQVSLAQRLAAEA